MNEREQHFEADVNMKQTFSWPMVMQIVGMLVPLAVVYATLTGNDREMQAQIAQLKTDQLRMEGNTKDLKTEIRADLQSIIAEIREMRADISKRNK